MSSENSYYDVGDVRTIDVIRAKLTPEQFRGGLLFNVLKYAMRMNHKRTPASDAAKLVEYAKWLHETYDTDGDNT